MTQATPRDSTPPLNTPIPGLSDAAAVLNDLAAQPDRARLIAAALALDTLIKTTTPSRDLLDAAAGLQVLATGGTLDLDDAGRSRARKLADTVRQLIVDPIYAAIEAHRAAYAAYDEAAEAPDEENDEAFRALDQASQRLMRAEASTLAGLTALLRYVAPLLQEAGAPGLPIEVPFAGRWSAAFGTFCANVADRLPAILATPEYVDYVEMRSSRQLEICSMTSRWSGRSRALRSRPLQAGRGPAMKPDPAATRLLNLLVAICGDQINSYRPKISRRL
jgi:hypothetical protein